MRHILLILALIAIATEARVDDDELFESFTPEEEAGWQNMTNYENQNIKLKFFRFWRRGCSAVHYYAATRSTQYKHIEVSKDDWKSLRKAGFNRRKKILVMTHGYLGRYTRNHMEKIREGAQNASINYIAVDWSKISTKFPFNYLKIARNVKRVGYCVADFIHYLTLALEIPLSNFHLVGHSLGAHISGFAGKRFQEKYGKKLDRITGLDPAAPLFNIILRRKRLARTDAKSVDCIYTGRPFGSTLRDTCTVNFKPNGGTVVQPPCKKRLVGRFVCSHMIACYYFAASMDKHNRFEGEHCYYERKEVSCNGVLMGYPAPNSFPRGEVYLRTGSRYPYALKVVKREV